ncbi:MAG TPA: ATP-dependent zinc metalloprotease FtsH [Longimicrobiales bacterium]|nr:ATP-dependent zinc metalloprotease FtsH [Longimicrobiales bacterium]
MDRMSNDRNDKKNEKKPEPRGGRWSRLSRTLSFWLMVILVPLVILQLASPPQEEAADFTYSQFQTQLRADNVASVTVIEGKRVEGELRSPVSLEGEPVEKFHTLLPIQDSEEIIAEMEAHGVAITAEEPDQNWWAVLIQMLPWLLLIGIWVIFLRQMQSGGSKAFQFGKSKAKLLTGDTPKVTFADVAGADEAKDELQEIIEFLKDPQKFSRLGGRLPKGALLIGPPGTGKTLLARAVAGEAGRPFFSMSGSDFVEMFVGVGASRVRDLFEQGKQNAPCIIFIDEIDAVGRHRGAGLGGGHDEREQTLNQLLVEMDGFESNEGVILLAATNRPDVLDPALLRPGRFDRQIVVDAPDVKGREGILRVHLRKIPLAEDVEVVTLAKGTPGMSGAELANLVNEGALLAARRNQDKVFMHDLEDAKDKVMLGAERKSMVLSEAERRLTAYHEAGHAVIALRLEGLDPIHKVTIVPRGRALGVTSSLPEEDRHSYSKDYLIARLVMLFGGRAAEELVFGPEKITTGAGNDIERATHMARRMVTQFGMSEAVGLMAVGEMDQEVFLGRELGQRQQVSERTAELVDGEVKRLLDEGYTRAVGVLRANTELLEAIASGLLERETLDREEVDTLARGELLPEAQPRPDYGLKPVPDDGEDPDFSRRARELADRARQALGDAEGTAASSPAGNGGRDDSGHDVEGEEEDDDVPAGSAARDRRQRVDRAEANPDTSR